MVRLTDEFRTLTVLKADDRGLYRFEGIRLKEGLNRLSLDFVGADGEVREFSREVLRDSTPPALTVLEPSVGATARKSPPLVSGLTEPGVEISVQVDSVSAGQTRAGAEGSFAVQLDRQSEGRHDVAITATDAAGNSSAEHRALALDTMAPEVRILSPDTGVLTRRSKFGVRQSRAYRASLNVVLQSEVGATVELLVNNESRGSVETGPTGEVRFLNVSLPQTQIWLGARATDAAGNVGHARPVWLGQPKS
ncbi:MAG: hypothetical protein GW911_11260 [Armatimonadetes bacterium]|nr:hypothetical protein [Armatimonadota bacterium]NCP28946.1 hypothetical protein [Armatimonadota bacterium]NDK12612.1 hypothetical protein [Armatimonadota bacterium]